MTNSISSANKIALPIAQLLGGANAAKLKNIIAYPDASVRAAANKITSQNPFNHSQIDAHEAMDLIKAAGDLDGQAAGRELKAIENFLKLNEGRLTDTAKQVLNQYIGAAKTFENKGMSGIPAGEFNNLMKDLAAVAKTEDATPDIKDASVGITAAKLLATNEGDDSISGAEAMKLVNATGDLDGQAAGQELKDIKNFMSRYGDMLSPQATQVLEKYVATAQKFADKGQSGIPQKDWNAMMSDIKAMLAPKPTTSAPTGGSGSTSGTESSSSTGSTSSAQSASETSSSSSAGGAELDPTMALVLALLEMADKLKKKAGNKAKEIDNSGEGSMNNSAMAQMNQMIDDSAKLVKMATNLQKKDNEAKDAIIRVVG